MKTIGLLGGMSWESTVHYYQIINEEVQNKLGGLHSAKIVLYSVDFSEIEQYQFSGQWEKCGEILGKAAKCLETAGVDFILICLQYCQGCFSNGVVSPFSDVLPCTVWIVRRSKSIQPQCPGKVGKQMILSSVSISGL